MQFLQLNLLEGPSGKVESNSTMTALLMLHQLVGGNPVSGYSLLYFDSQEEQKLSEIIATF